jgi:hypothetical protein
MFTGRRSATGVTTPVRPTPATIRRTWLTSLRGGNLIANAAAAEIVELHDEAIDFVLEVIASRGEVGEVGEHPLGVVRPRVIRVHGKPPRREGTEDLLVAVEGAVPIVSTRTRSVEHVVGVQRERPFGGERGIELPNRACGEISGARERALPLGEEAFVDVVEGTQREVDLTADRKPVRDGERSVVEFAREMRDRRHRVGDHLTDVAIPAGDRPHEPSPLVHEFDREPIDLRFERVAHRADVPERAAQARIELHERIELRRRVEAPHRCEMLRGREAAPGRYRRPHPLREALLGGEGRLEFAQFTPQRVIRFVADLRVVENVVPVIVTKDLLTKHLDACEHRARVRGERGWHVAQCRFPRPTMEDPIWARWPRSVRRRSMRASKKSWTPTNAEPMNTTARNTTRICNVKATTPSECHT